MIYFLYTFIKTLKKKQNKMTLQYIAKIPARGLQEQKQ